MAGFYFPADQLKMVAVAVFRRPTLEQAVKQHGRLVGKTWVISKERLDSILRSITPETHPAYPAKPKKGFTPKPLRAPPTSGPGVELKKLLKRVGITASPTCSCNACACRMDEEEAKEPGWCEAHLDEIVGWLREEATKRGLPFVDMAGRVLVKRAISNARKAEARRAKEAQPAESGPA
jgi:hypothetical protein